jgi:hypothetical protein
MAIKGDSAFRWPPRMRTDPFKRDRNKFCEYHGDLWAFDRGLLGSSTRDRSVCPEMESCFRFLAQERGREVNQQGLLPLEGNREGLGAHEPRRRDPAPIGGQYGNREEEQRNAREEQRHHQNQEVVREIHTISERSCRWRGVEFDKKGIC